jgi:pyridinium-3,5-biscarboxylic acid mononucleotide synthase
MSSLKDVLDKLASREITATQAEKLLKLHAIDQIGCFAKLDGNREMRKGVPEIILAEGKTSRDVLEISKIMLEKNGRVIVSRSTKEHVKALKEEFNKDSVFEVNDKAGIVVLKKKDFTVCQSGGRVAILTAGTSDIPVAEEAKIVAQEMGCNVWLAYDVGVAGIHRLLEPMKEIVANDVDVLVVVAGREGALASVVSGLIDIPVIAVPTSNSYGFGGKGVGTLMAMLQSCSLGLAVVNIDGGVAAGAVAALIANRAGKSRKQP